MSARARKLRPPALLRLGVWTACAFVSLLASCAAPAPTEGVIIFHEPDRKGHWRTWVLVSGQDELADQALAKARAGAIKGAGDTRSSSDREAFEIAKKVFQTVPSTTVLTPEKFQDLWNRLRQAGLFDISTGADVEPPEERPYFLVKTAGWRRVYERPSMDARLPDGHRWYYSKKALVDFLNEQ